MRVAIVGAGSWGTTVAGIVAARPEVDAVIWAREPETAEQIVTEHVNRDYIPELTLPESLEGTNSLEEACVGAEAIVMGVPSHGIRGVVQEAAPFIEADVPIVSLAKGVEVDTNLRGTQIILEALSDHDRSRVGVLTGPNLAREVAAGMPTASVVAMPDEEIARRFQQLFMTPTLRIYTNPDVVGCEIAGALKNVIAIGAGIASGLGYGNNTLAALLTRGLAELTRLGVAVGGHALTFGGLAGVGDLIATCMSDKSRNRTVGYKLGQGQELDDIVSDMNMVAEGVKSTEAVLDLARAHAIEMPIAEQVGAVLYEGRKAADIVPALMSREAKSEGHGIAEAREKRDT